MASLPAEAVSWLSLRRFVDSKLILSTLAPEIDIFEALVLPARNRGEVSMSAQWVSRPSGVDCLLRRV
jgi:hypothetical protein